MEPELSSIDRVGALLDATAEDEVGEIVEHEGLYAWSVPNLVALFARPLSNRRGDALAYLAQEYQIGTAILPLEEAVELEIEEWEASLRDRPLWLPGPVRELRTPSPDDPEPKSWILRYIAWGLDPADKLRALRLLADAATDDVDLGHWASEVGEAMWVAGATDLVAEAVALDPVMAKAIELARKF